MSSPGTTNFRHVVFAPPRQRLYAAIDFGPRQASAANAAGDADSSPQDAWFTAWSLRQAGINAGMYRPGMLQRRLSAVLRSLKVTSSSQAKSVLQSDPQLLPSVLDALLIGVTGFFRDPEVFAALDRYIAAELDRREGGLTVWSVGCASGAELYSVAMLLADRVRLRDSLLLGTDCRQGAIASALTGRYNAETLQGLAPDLIARYFKADPPRWIVSETIRDSCRWQCANALDPVEPGRWDVILCRNMVSYMTNQAGAALWRRLENSLRPGGLLVVGRTERPIGAMNLKLIEPCLYRRTGD